MKNRRILIANAVSIAMLVVFTGRTDAQMFPIAETDIPKLKLNHYFTPDNKSHEPDFEWTFTKTGFTIKKGKGAIPAHLTKMLLPEGVVAEEITGNWTLKDGELKLTHIKAGDKEIKKDVNLGIFSTAVGLVRICDPEQFVFWVVR